jgi:DNA processing protein
MTGATGANADAAPSWCVPCVRRSWLLARLAGWIEIARHDRTALPEVLALGDEVLVRAVAPKEAGRVLAERERFAPDALVAAARRASLTIVCRHDPGYPPKLLHARDAPAALFVAGRPERLAALGTADAGLGCGGDEPWPVVGIVGTRRPTPDGLEVARSIARDLALAGVPVVSGMALGIDSAAQTGALDAGGLSVAVLAGGADVPYPRRKAHLHRRLVDDGLVVSELPPGFAPRRWCFPARNRTIAGLADLTLVIEAAERSGSLITAELAMKLGRDVAAVPGPVTSPVASGTNALLRDGAILVRHAQDVLDALFGVGAAPAVRRTHADGLEPRLAAVLDAVAAGRDTLGALAGPTAQTAEEALVALTELELRGLLRRGVGRTLCGGL